MRKDNQEDVEYNPVELIDDLAKSIEETATMVLGLKRKMDAWELAQEQWRSDLEQKVTSSVVKHLEGGILEKCIEKLRDQVLGLLVNEPSKATAANESQPVSLESRSNAEAASGGSETAILGSETSSPGRARSSSRTMSIATTGAPDSLMGTVKRMAPQDIQPHSSFTLPNSARDGAGCGSVALPTLAQSQTPRAPQQPPVSVISPISGSPVRQASLPVTALPTALHASSCAATHQFSGAPLLYSCSAGATGPPAVQVADGQSLRVWQQTKICSAADLQDFNGPAVRSCSTIRNNVSSLRKEMAEQSVGLLQSSAPSIVTGAASAPVPQQTPRAALGFMQQQRQPQTTPQMMQRGVSQTPPAPALRRAPAGDSQYIPAVAAQQLQPVRQAQSVHTPASLWSASQSDT